MQCILYMHPQSDMPNLTQVHIVTTRSDTCIVTTRVQSDTSLQYFCLVLGGGLQLPPK